MRNQYDTSRVLLTLVAYGIGLWSIATGAELFREAEYVLVMITVVNAAMWFAFGSLLLKKKL